MDGPVGARCIVPLWWNICHNNPTKGTTEMGTMHRAPMMVTSTIEEG